MVIYLLRRFHTFYDECGRMGWLENVRVRIAQPEHSHRSEGENGTRICSKNLQVLTTEAFSR